MVILETKRSQSCKFPPEWTWLEPQEEPEGSNVIGQTDKRSSHLLIFFFLFYSGFQLTGWRPFTPKGNLLHSVSSTPQKTRKPSPKINLSSSDLFVSIMGIADYLAHVYCFAFCFGFSSKRVFVLFCFVFNFGWSESSLGWVSSLVTVNGLLYLWHTGSRACGLSCTEACGIIVPPKGMKPMSPALEDGFLTTGPPRKSWWMVLLLFF